MRQKLITTGTYLLTAVMCSILALASSQDQRFVGVLQILLTWLPVCGIPLLFAFAYSRYLFAGDAQRKPMARLTILHAGAATAALVVFVYFSPASRNPLRDSDSIALIIVLIAILVALFVSAIFLAVKKKSSLATFTSILFWPYWLIQVLIFEGYWGFGTTAHELRITFYGLLCRLPLP